MGRRSWRHSIVYGLAAVSLLLLVGLIVLCSVTDTHPIIRRWTAPSGRVHVIHIANGRIAFLSIDAQLQEDHREEILESLLRRSRFVHQGELADSLGFNIHHAIYDHEDQILYRIGVRSILTVSLPDWFFMLFAALLPGILAWRALDRRSGAANKVVREPVTANAVIPEATASAGVAPLQYFSPPPDANSKDKYAGVIRHAIGFALDYVIFGLSFGAGVLSLRRTFTPPDDVVNAILGISFVIYAWLYFAVSESSAWQATPGKRILGMRVTDMNEGRITFSRATARLLAKIISYIPLGAGFVLPLFTRKRQALHDMAAGTLVLRDRLHSKDLAGSTK